MSLTILHDGGDKLKDSDFNNRAGILKKIIDAGYNTREKIIKMNMNDVDKLKGLTIKDFHLINELIPIVKEKRLLDFFTKN